MFSWRQPCGEKIVYRELQYTVKVTAATLISYSYNILIVADQTFKVAFANGRGNSVTINLKVETCKFVVKIQSLLILIELDPKFQLSAPLVSHLSDSHRSWIGYIAIHNQKSFIGWVTYSCVFILLNSIL